MKTNIKQAREKAKKQQQECADEIGVTLRAWQGYEQGIREPKFETLCKIADMFNVSLDYLLGRAPAPDPFADFNLPPNSEKDVIEKYMSFSPEIRACLLDALRKLGAAVDGDIVEAEPQTTEPPALNDIAEDIADTVLKVEQAFSKAHTDKK